MCHLCVQSHHRLEQELAIKKVSRCPVITIHFTSNKGPSEYRKNLMTHFNINLSKREQTTSVSLVPTSISKTMSDFFTEWIHCAGGEPSVLLPYSESGVPGVPGGEVVCRVCGESEGRGPRPVLCPLTTGQSLLCLVSSQTLCPAL